MEPSSPLVIAGLGNPGQKYDGTRHNVGFRLIDAFARVHNCTWSARREFEAETASLVRNGRRIYLVKPQTYVNESGRAAGAICRYFRIDPKTSLIVVYDEINIELGRIKISVRGSAGGHNGIESLIRHVGAGFIRFRIGIGPRHPPGIDLKDFVLGRFTADQEAELTRREPEFLQALHLLIDSGPNAAMNRINQKKNQQDEPNQPELQSDLRSRHAGQEGIGRGCDRDIEKGD